jgi:hypothetical protein
MNCFEVLKIVSIVTKTKSKAIRILRAFNLEDFFLKDFFLKDFLLLLWPGTGPPSIRSA